MRVQLAGVGKHHGAQVILDQVTLTIGPKARIGLVGPNGVGKTTLLRIVAGHEQPDAGTVTRAPERLTVGYLAQERAPERGQSVLESLARRAGIERRRARARGRPRAHSRRGLAADDRYCGRARPARRARGRELRGARPGDLRRARPRRRSRPGARRPVRRRGGARRARGDPALPLRPPAPRRADQRPRLRRARAARAVPRARIEARSSSSRTIASSSIARSTASRRSSPTRIGCASGRAASATTRPPVTPSGRRRSPSTSRRSCGGRQLTQLLSTRRTEARAKGRALGRQDRRPGSPRDACAADEGAPGGAAARAQRAAAEAVRAVGARSDASRGAPGRPISCSGSRARSRSAARFGSARSTSTSPPASGCRSPAPNGTGKSTLAAGCSSTASGLVAGERSVGRRTVIGAIGQERDAYSGEAPLVDELMARTGLSRVDARTLLAKFGLRADHIGRRVLVAVARRAHARASRGAPGARREPARPRRADEPPRSRGGRAARKRARRLRRDARRRLARSPLPGADRADQGDSCRCPL